MTVTHSKVSAKTDGADSSLVRPSDWNADHTVTNLVPAAVATDYGAVGDGTTDNGSALQDWINSGFTDLYLPTGTYAFATVLTLNNTVRNIFGPGTLKWTGLDGVTCLTVASYTGNALIFDGIHFSVDIGTYTNVDPVLISGGNNISFINCHFLNGGRHSITVTDATNVCVQGCIFEHFLASAVWVRDSTNVRVLNNVVLCNLENTDFHAIYIQTCTASNISGNSIDQSYNFSIWVLNEAGGIVANNRVTNARLDAIKMDASIDGLGGTPTGISRNWVVANNVVDVASDDLGFGCTTYDSSSHISNGQFIGNVAYNTGSVGMLIASLQGGTIQDINITSNLIIDADRTHNNGTAIVLTSSLGTITRTLFTANYVGFSAADTTYCIQESGSGVTYTRVGIDNEFYNFTTSPVSLVSTTSYAQNTLPALTHNFPDGWGTNLKLVDNAGGAPAIWWKDSLGDTGYIWGAFNNQFYIEHETNDVFDTGISIASTAEYRFIIPIRVPSYTVSGLPSAATAARIAYVSDETGGATLAFTDGANWRRVQDRAIVSS